MNAYEECRQAADLGIKRAADGAKAWHPFMRLCVRAAALAHPTVTMDEVLDVAKEHIDLAAPPFNLMAFGARMQAAQKEGMLLRTDRTRPSRRVTQHRNRAVYLSRIYSPGAIATRGGIQPLLIDYGEMPPERQPLTFADEIA